MASNKEIVFESNCGIIFERTILINGEVRLAVIYNRGNEIITDYCYVNAPELRSPYLNWENLNCCDGWVHDETYLHTAVQNGKKLYSGIIFRILRRLCQNYHTACRVAVHVFRPP